MGILRRRWLQIFLSGLVLLYLVERALIATQNPNYIPSAILLGAFLVPITFTAYLYERLPDWEVPLSLMAVCFVWGGVLGTVAAGALEHDVVKALGFLPAFGIGLIEEGAKLMVPLALYFVGRHRSEADGIILGVATAMGFAAFETMGYALTSLLASHGNLAILDGTLLVRGLASPVGHAAWTGLVCAVLWRERLRAGHIVFNWRIGGAFLTAVTLHALWDTTFGFGAGALGRFMGAAVLGLPVALVGMTLLIRRVREAQRQPALVSTPEVGGDGGRPYRPSGYAGSYTAEDRCARPISRDEEDRAGGNMPRIGSEGLLREGAHTTGDRRGALQDSKAGSLGPSSRDALDAGVESANSVGRETPPERKDNVLEDTRSPTWSSKFRRVSHRKELAVVTLAMVASISGVGGLLAAHQPTSSQPTQTAGASNRPVVVSAARRDGAGRRPVRLEPSSWRSDDGREIDDARGHSTLHPAKTHRVHAAVPTFSAHSHRTPSAVSHGSPPLR
jgi:RsiW-degrading membrane proteinase PrsW (M82 family)